jgi:hypothetical protein
MILILSIIILFFSFSKKGKELIFSFLGFEEDANSQISKLQSIKNDEDNLFFRNLLIGIHKIEVFISLKYRMILLLIIFYFLVLIVLDMGIHGGRYSISHYILRLDNTWKLNFDSTAKVFADGYCNTGFWKNITPLSWQHFFMKLYIPESDLDEYYNLIGQCK